MKKSFISIVSIFIIGVMLILFEGQIFAEVSSLDLVEVDEAQISETAQQVATLQNCENCQTIRSCECETYQYCDDDYTTEIDEIITEVYKKPYFNTAAIGSSLGFRTHSNILAVSILDVMIKFRELPIMFSLDAFAATGGFSLGFTADWLLLNSNFGFIGLADLHFYLTPGADFSFGFYDVFDIGLSARLPIGLSWLLDSNLEIFTEIVLTLHIVSFGVGTPSYIKLAGFGVAGESIYHWNDTITTGINLGIRYWFQ